jgi:RNA polymerase sigma-70 factor (ECF subfamily)
MPDVSDDAAVIDSLVRRAGQGDAAAFAGLYDLFAPRLRRFLRYQVADADAAEDLLQQVFVKMIEAMPRYRAQGVPFAAWVFRIARNLVIDGRRTAHPAAPIEAALDHQTQDEGPELAAERADDRARLIAAIDVLPADQRDVLVWRFFGELSPVETASVMGRSTEAVRSLQHRAVLALRANLAGSGWPDARSPR